MKIAIFGTGYVGLVSAACFAETGNQVICIDIDEQKIQMLKNGEMPFFEPQLSELVKKNYRADFLKFTTNAKQAIESADLIFIAVGTPSRKDGSANLEAVFSVVETLKAHENSTQIIVIKSTVPIGTTDGIQKQLPQTVVFNPEFLKQGCAVTDCLHPDRIVVGTDDTNAIGILKKLYAPYYQADEKFLSMDTRSAEMTKYAANAMLATKISFINEMAQIADRVDANIYDVRDGIALDERIGPHFINPGLGYGGSCFSKDIEALKKISEGASYSPKLLHAVATVNDAQKLFLFDKVMRFYNGDLKGKVFAIWGLSFKPNTDDLRDAASIVLIQALWKQGATIQAFDPKAMPNFKKQFGEDDRYVLCNSKEEALGNADALCVVTEWSEFFDPDLSTFSILKDWAVFDGRHVLNADACQDAQLTYFGV